MSFIDLLSQQTQVSPPREGGGFTPRKRRKRGVGVAVLLVLITLTTPAFAQDANFDRDVLRSIDTVPTRAQLDADFEDARGQLEAAAVDEQREMWQRHRAITLLSQYPDTRTRAFLEGLLDDADHHVRRMAVYTLGRSFGTQADARLVATLRGVIANDADDEVVQWAVRSLRWVHHDEARELLRTLAERDDAKGRIAALALKRSRFVPDGER